MVIGSRQRRATFDGHRISVIVGKHASNGSKSNSLVLTIDVNLTWEKHIEEISKKVSSGISALKRIRNCSNEDTAFIRD